MGQLPFTNNNYLIQELDYLKEISDIPSFSICSSIGSKMIFSHSFGISSQEQNTLISEHTLYDLASVTKLYTAAIVLRLHEKNALDIFKPVSYFNQTFSSSNLRVVDLLAHKANFGVKLADIRKLGPSAFKKALYSIKPPVSPSDTTFYENITYIHLGNLIEIVTKKSLRENMIEFLDSLDLRETFLGENNLCLLAEPTEITNEGTVRGITHDESARTLGGLTGNAGVFSTAYDLCKFGSYWLSGDIISLKLLYETVLINYDDSLSKPQALGWWMRIPGLYKNCNGLYSHTGFTGCLLAICPDSGTTISFTCNRTLFGRDNKAHYMCWRIILKHMGFDSRCRESAI